MSTPESKPGIKTTEFWITVVTNVVMFLQMFGTDIISSLPDRYAALAVAAVNGLYAVSRGLAKQGVAYTTPSTVVKP